MESLQCSNMKPMTIEQEAAYTKYKIDHTEINRKQLHDWEVNWEVNCLAMKIIGDIGKNIGARPDGPTITSKQ